MIPIFRPWFDNAEVEAVREVLMSGWVGPGEKVEELEARFAHYVGAQHAVSLNSCSAALLLALKILDVEGRRSHYHTLDLCIDQSRNFAKRSHAGFLRHRSRNTHSYRSKSNCRQNHGAHPSDYGGAFCRAPLRHG